MAIQNTTGIGVPQNVLGMVEATRVYYPDLIDIGGLSPEMRSQVEMSLLNNVFLPQGKRLGTNMPVTRTDLAAMLLRAGVVPQYMASEPIFTDVRDVTTRNATESIFTHPNGKLFDDVSAGNKFFPNASASKLLMAVAMVRAMNLSGLAETSVLPPTITDAASIPIPLRGYVAVALQRGFIQLDGNLFNPTRPITRLELICAGNVLSR